MNAHDNDHTPITQEEKLEQAKRLIDLNPAMAAEARRQADEVDEAKFWIDAPPLMAEVAGELEFLLHDYLNPAGMRVEQGNRPIAPGHAPLIVMDD